MSKYFSVLILLLLGGCDFSSSDPKTVKSSTHYDGVLMDKICDLPEDISVFSSYVYDNYGHEMSESSVNKMLAVFEMIHDSQRLDGFYSRTERLRLIALSKKCTAADGVEYEWRMAVTIKPDGNSFFHQMYLLYKFSDMYDGKRKFNFKNMNGKKEEYSKLISKQIFGKSRDKVAIYMKNVGANLVDSSEFSEEYVYEVDAKNDMASRLGGGYFGKRITVIYDSTQRVDKVNVKGS